MMDNPGLRDKGPEALKQLIAPLSGSGKGILSASEELHPL